MALFLELIPIFVSDDIYNIGSYQEGMAFKPNDTSTMTNSNHRPVVFNMVLTPEIKGPVAFALNASDPDEGDILTFAIVANPARGIITSFDSSSGGGVYNPGSDITNSVAQAQDSFAFKAIDANGAARSAGTVTIRFPLGG